MTLNDTLIVGLIASGSALTGSFITGGFTYLASVKQRQAKKYKRNLIHVNQDVAAFYRLEEFYLAELAMNTFCLSKG